MSDIIFEILKIVVMVAVLIISRYVVPYVREKIGSSNMDAIAAWAKYAVLNAQQVMWAKEPAERKAYVTDFLKRLLIEKNISISDEQLDILIEAAVKQMKIDENAGIVIEAVDEAPARNTSEMTE